MHYDTSTTRGTLRGVKAIRTSLVVRLLALVIGFASAVFLFPRFGNKLVGSFLSGTFGIPLSLLILLAILVFAGAAIARGTTRNQSVRIATFLVYLALPMLVVLAIPLLLFLWALQDCC